MASRISVLGTSDLRRSDGGQVQSVVHQPRRFALLVYLALASRQGPVRRDTVMGVFWAEKPQDKARGALNQAIHYLRRSLGQDAIVTTHDTIALDRTLVSCDAAEFLDAIDGERWRDAADVYAGDLMPGFFDSAEAIDFEHWLEAERQRLERAASRAAWNLAKEAEAAGETADAVVWARRACEWSTNDEAETRRLMTFMADLGDRTGVLDAYDSLEAALRPLAVEPAPGTTALVRSLRKEWEEEDREAADVSAGPMRRQRTTRPRDQARPEPLAAAGPWSRLRRLRSGAVTLVLTVALISLWGLRRNGRTAENVPPENQHPSVLVETLTAETDAPVAAGALGDQIVTHLQSMTGFNVVDGTEGTPARATPANFVLRGGLVRIGDHLQANVHLIDGRTGNAVASEQFDRTQPDSLATLDELSAAIANFTRRSIGAIEEERRIADADAPPGAITLVQLGRGDLKLADSLASAEIIGTAEAAYRKADSVFAEAADIAPQWGTPWTERAETAYKLVWLHQFAVDGKGQERAIEKGELGIQFADRALKRAPDPVEALEVRALLEWTLWNLKTAEGSGASGDLLLAAEKDARRVTAMTPRRARAWNVLGAISAQRGEWSDAYWALTRAVAADTYMQNNLEIILRLYMAAWETGNMEAARNWCDLAKQRVGDTWPTAYCLMGIEAVSDRPDTALIPKLRTQLSAQPGWNTVEAAFTALSAVLYARAGDAPHARRLLAKKSENPTDLPNLPVLRAWAWLEAGNEANARALLDGYVKVSPTARNGILRSRRFVALTVPVRN